MGITFTEYLDRIEEGSRVLASPDAGGTGKRVPSCPGWNTDDLLAHCCNVLLQKLPLLRARSLEPPDPQSWTRADPASPNLPAQLGEAASVVLAELRAIGPDVPLWSWYAPDRSSSFWARRLAHELAIHRVDLELALDTAVGCDPALAADGVGEVLEVFLARPGRPVTDSGGDAVVRLQGTDLPCSWSVRMTDSGALVSAELVDRADAAIAGPVSPLYLWLWGRSSPEMLETRGDITLRDRLRSLLALAT